MKCYHSTTLKLNCLLCWKERLFWLEGAVNGCCSLTLCSWQIFDSKLNKLPSSRSPLPLSSHALSLHSLVSLLTLFTLWCFLFILLPCLFPCIIMWPPHEWRPCVSYSVTRPQFPKQPWSQSWHLVCNYGIYKQVQEYIDLNFQGTKKIWRNKVLISVFQIRLKEDE